MQLRITQRGNSTFRSEKQKNFPSQNHSLYHMMKADIRGNDLTNCKKNEQVKCGKLSGIFIQIWREKERQNYLATRTLARLVTVGHKSVTWSARDKSLWPAQICKVITTRFYFAKMERCHNEFAYLWTLKWQGPFSFSSRADYNTYVRRTIFIKQKQKKENFKKRRMHFFSEVICII